MTIKKAVWWVFFWVGLALIFNAGVYVFMGREKALEFLGGYIIEQSLSLDNLFLFLMIFTSFGIEPLFQRRVLNYGIFGAIVLRLIFVILGVAVVSRFHWILYVFGFILIASGIKMAVSREEFKTFDDSLIIRTLRQIVPISDGLHGEKFFVRIKNVLHVTPLFAILVLIEGSDIVFAVDSIPAIFSVTTDPFIVYTSNIFAIMGLRSMYFVLERLHQSFHYVKLGVAAILTFTGLKLSFLYFHVEIPLLLSIGIIAGLLLLSILASVLFPQKEVPECTNKY